MKGKILLYKAIFTFIFFLYAASALLEAHLSTSASVNQCKEVFVLVEKRMQIIICVIMTKEDASAENVSSCMSTFSLRLKCL